MGMATLKFAIDCAIAKDKRETSIMCGLQVLLYRVKGLKLVYRIMALLDVRENAQIMRWNK
jgi:hypothetical protein